MQTITDLATLGWPLFPVLAGSKNPATEHGFKDASTDPAQIAKWMRKYPGCNWGLVPPATAWVLDIDPLDDGSPNKAFTQDQLFDIASSAGAISTTPGKLNPSTGAFTPGKHYWFRQPNPGKWISRNGWLPNVDCRSKTGYLVIPPSVRPHGVYTWALPLDCRPEELPLPPEWLVDMVNKDQSKRTFVPATPIIGAETEPIPIQSDAPTRVLTHGQEAYVNTTPYYQHWAKHLIETVAGGTPVRTCEDGTVIYRRPGKMDGQSGTWNSPAGRHGVSGRSQEPLWFPRFYCFSPNWPPFACEDHNGHRKGYDTWELLHLLLPPDKIQGLLLEVWFDMRAELGDYGDEEQPAEWPEDEDDTPAPVQVHTVEPDTSSTDELLDMIRGHIRPGGILDLFAQEVAGREYMRQPLFRYSAGLGMLSALLGGRVAGRDGTRSNIYFINVAPTGEGKDCARDVLVQVLTRAAEGIPGLDEQARLNSLCIKLPHSGNGLVSALREQPVRLIVADELGAILQTYGDGRGSTNGNGKQLLTYLTELYTTNVGPWFPPLYADNTRNKGAIDSPFVSMLGFTVLSELVEALTPESVNSGLLPRICLFLGESKAEIVDDCNHRDATQWNESLIGQVREWMDFNRKQGSMVPEFHHHWTWEPEALELINTAFREWITKRREYQAQGRTDGALFSRCAQTAKRLAMVFAADRLETPQAEQSITVEDVRLGCYIVDHTANQMLKLCEDNLASTQFGRGAKTVQQWFASRPGQMFTIREIMRGCRTRILEDPRHRDQILNDLVQMGFLKAANGKPTSRGTPIKIYGLA